MVATRKITAEPAQDERYTLPDGWVRTPLKMEPSLIDELFAKADAIEAAVEAARRRAEKLE